MSTITERIRNGGYEIDREKVVIKIRVRMKASREGEGETCGKDGRFGLGHRTKREGRLKGNTNLTCLLPCTS